MWITSCGGGGDPHFDESCGSVSGEPHARAKDSARAKGARKKYFDIRLRISKRVVALAVVAVVCISAAMAGLVLYRNTREADASSNSTNTGTYNAKYTGLFIKDPNNENAGLMGPNGVNRSIAGQLLSALSNAGVTGSNTRDASHFGASVPGVDAYGNGAIYVRLFDSMTGTGYTHSFTTSDSAQGGGARWWRAVYAQNGNITFWMAERYRSFSYEQNSYEPTRAEIKSDFDAVESGLHADAKALIVSPGIPAQADTPTPHWTQKVPNPAVTAGDKVFLPSVWEIANNSTSQQSGSDTSSAANAQTRSGQWRLSGLDRGSVGHSWLRSYRRTETYYSPDYLTTVLQLDDTGRVGANTTSDTNWFPTPSLGLRPAIRLNTFITQAPKVHCQFNETLAPGYGSSIISAATSDTSDPRTPSITILAKDTVLTFDAGKDLKINGMTICGEDVTINANEAEAMAQAPDGRNYPNSGTTRYRAWYEGEIDADRTAQIAKIKLMNIDDKHITDPFSSKYVEGNTAMVVNATRSAISVMVNGTVTLRYVDGINAPEGEFGQIEKTWYFSTLFASSMVLPSVEYMNALAEKAGHEKEFVGWFEDAACTIEIAADATGKIMIPVSWAGQVRDVYAKWTT